jgi:hypothetical protein
VIIERLATKHSKYRAVTKVPQNDQCCPQAGGISGILLVQALVYLYLCKCIRSPPCGECCLLPCNRYGDLLITVMPAIVCANILGLPQYSGHMFAT